MDTSTILSEKATLIPTIAQRGSGRGPLILGFHIGGDGLCKALAAAGLADATAAVHIGSYAPLPSWHSILTDIAERASWQGGPVVLAGWSAGAGAVRELLSRGACPEVVLCLDGGVGGDMPPAPDVVRVWRETAERARGGDGLFVLSHTYQTYTETLPGAQAFPSTVTVARLATGLPLPAPKKGHVAHRDRGLVVLSYASKAIDAEAHSAQQTKALPFILSQYVAPHLAPYMTPRPRGTGEAALAVAIGELGVREEPPGSNSGPRVRQYLAGCVRDVDSDGDLDKIGLSAGSWCAAFTGWCDAQAGVPRTWRAAVHEIVSDARKAGTLRGLDYTPRPGDLAIFKRDGQDPRKGGLGHVARVEKVEGGTFTAIDGNSAGDKVARVVRPMTDAALVAWVEYPRAG